MKVVFLPTELCSNIAELCNSSIVEYIDERVKLEYNLITNMRVYFNMNSMCGSISDTEFENQIRKKLPEVVTSILIYNLIKKVGDIGYDGLLDDFNKGFFGLRLYVTERDLADLLTSEICVGLPLEVRLTLIDFVSDYCEILYNKHEHISEYNEAFIEFLYRIGNYPQFNTKDVMSVTVGHGTSFMIFLNGDNDAQFNNTTSQGHGS